MSLRLNKSKRQHLADEVAKRVAPRCIPKPPEKELAKDLPSPHVLLEMIERTPEYSETTFRPAEMETQKRLKLNIDIFPDRKEITLPRPIPILKRGDVVINHDFKLVKPSFWTDDMMSVESRTDGRYHKFVPREWQTKLYHKQAEIRAIMNDRIASCNTIPQLLTTYPGGFRYELVQRWVEEDKEKRAQRKENMKPRERMDGIDRSCILKARLLGAKI